MAEAWAAYDRLFEDDRICFMPEPAAIEEGFREPARLTTASRNLWADAYLSAFAQARGSCVRAEPNGPRSESEPYSFSLPRE